MPCRGSFLLWLCLVFASLSPASAQTVGVIRGEVLDLAGAPLPGVTVTAQSPEHQATPKGSVTDAHGAFLIPGLPPARDYVVRASLSGYATVRVSGVEALPGPVVALRIVLSPAQTLRQTVEVRATPDIVTLEESSASTRFSSEFLDALPILGRDYQDVLTLAPGVSDADGDGNPNIHGARDTDVVTLVDGISSGDPLTGKVGAQLNIESIDEIELKTAAAGAEFGRAQGGYANITTKSGGNQLEGRFTFYWRGSALDGDGAGIDKATLHGGIGESGLRELKFNDYLPFVSLGGPIARDHAWFYATLESIHKDDPINALNAAFVTGVRELRAFAKATWQVNPQHRLVLSLNYDPQDYLNQGLNSFTAEESGFTIHQGGLMATLRDTAVLSPSVALETSVAASNWQPSQVPNLDADTNGNGMLNFDRNGDGFFAASERDPGEDFDGDGAFDVWEDTLTPDGLLTEDERKFCIDRNGRTVQSPPGICAQPGVVSLLLNEDGFRYPYEFPGPFPPGDGDRRLTPPGGCEGEGREDIDCDGHLDRLNEDKNGNGRLDPGEDLDADGALDFGTEDRNGNRILDDIPFPSGPYPYGHTTPTPEDRDYSIDRLSGSVQGPYYESYDDVRKRFTLRQDLSQFITDAHGSHDIKMGYVLERETFAREATANGIRAIKDPGYRTGTLIDRVQHPDLHYDCDPYYEQCTDPGNGRIVALLPFEPSVDEAATGSTSGLYVQDLYKPRSNLSLSLGLRFERELLQSNGYTPFDPASDKALFDRLLALGFGEGPDDSLLGNNDGIVSRGIRADPFFTGGTTDPALAAAPWSAPLRRAAASRMMSHRSDLAFNLAGLSALFPELGQGDLDPHVLASLGVRTQQPEQFTVTNNNLAPRFALAWDPGGDGRTKLFGTWGRYYDKLFQSTVTAEQGTERLSRYYVLDRDGVDYNPPSVSSVVATATPDDHVGTTISKAPPSVSQVDRLLRTPFCDELTLGFEREIAPELALTIRYINRWFRDQLQDIDVNHVTRRNPVTGRPYDQLGTYVRAESGSNVPSETLIPAPDGHPDLYVNDFFFNEVLRIGNFNEARYKALEFEALKRMSRRWQMQASYVYSRATGDAEEFQSRLGNDPSTVESESGYLSFDQRHVVKVNSSIFLPHDWQLATAITWGSGLPYSTIARFFAADNIGFQQFRTAFGYSTAQGGQLQFVSVRRNSGRNGSTLDINLQTRKNFVLGKTTGAVIFEVFNLLNRDDLRIYTIDPSRGLAFDPSAPNGLTTPLEIDGVRAFGRRFQVGIQLGF